MSGKRSGINFKTVYEGEYVIQMMISNDNNCSAHFEYLVTKNDTDTLENDEIICLKLITYNPMHKTHFLLNMIKGEDKLDCLDKMYDHIYKLKTSLKEKESPYLNYSISWYCPNTQKTITSSFYGESIEQILLKFNYKKDKKLVIHHMKLNPVPMC